MVAGVLLEKQVVVVCPNPGVVSAAVLSLVPMIHPFQWQSLLLPILPARMLDFLDAPVPFIVGIQHKPVELKMKTSNLVQVNVLKDQAEAASQFLNVMRCYLESICSDLRSHTITSVQSDNDRVCLLLKDSFIDSFPNRDRPFIKLLVDTQTFTVLSDSHLSSFENGYC
ncbi:DENN domain-containing protein [Quillaja saponaria]|uniref:DENN domain-containing protein n=1 Tax=Quillaja saponaria TaxID=32244 RepID=A0AAD7Q0E1_QUISA|nr:DENN domain-containing protein [Quillaja saponaria]